MKHFGTIGKAKGSENLQAENRARVVNNAAARLRLKISQGIMMIVMMTVMVIGPAPAPVNI